MQLTLYRAETKPLSRNDKRSAVAAAAYRAGVDLTDERNGLVHEYARRSGVLHNEIITPDGQPVERQTLWNEAEKSEKRKDARTAREWIVKIPDELPEESRLRLVRNFAQHLVMDQGVAVDIAIHSPSRKGDDRNFHAHLLCTTRKFGRLESGAVHLGAKADMELSDSDRRKAGIGSAADGIKALRHAWETLTNGALEAAGLDIRVDARSLAARGIDRIPTVHMGPTATALERRGIRTRRGDLNRDIVARNALQAEIADLDRQIEAENRLQVQKAWDAAADERAKQKAKQKARREQEAAAWHQRADAAWAARVGRMRADPAAFELTRRRNDAEKAAQAQQFVTRLAEAASQAEAARPARSALASIVATAPIQIVAAVASTPAQLVGLVHLRHAQLERQAWREAAQRAAEERRQAEAAQRAAEERRQAEAAEQAAEEHRQAKAAQEAAQRAAEERRQAEAAPRAASAARVSIGDQIRMLSVAPAAAPAPAKPAVVPVAPAAPAQQPAQQGEDRRRAEVRKWVPTEREKPLISTAWLLEHHPTRTPKQEKILQAVWAALGDVARLVREIFSGMQPQKSDPNVLRNIRVIEGWKPTGTQLLQQLRDEGYLPPEPEQSEPENTRPPAPQNIQRNKGRSDWGIGD